MGFVGRLGAIASSAFDEHGGPEASLRDFLEHDAGLHAQELGAGEDRRVTISTIHRSKGTEATLVDPVGVRGATAPLLAIAALAGPRGALRRAADLLRRPAPAPRTD
jgi:hypothetical protein